MDFKDIAAKRHDIRKYTEKEISDELINDLLECANHAPSAGNVQPYKVAVIKDDDKIDAVADAAYNQAFVGEAQALIIVFANKGEAKSRYGERGEMYAVQDATIYTTYLILRAHELGLASCWVGSFDPDKVREIVGASALVEPIVILTLGYPGSEPGKVGRKNIKDYVFREVFE